MVLISIREQGFKRVIDALSKAEGVEIRLDFCNLTPSEISTIFASDKCLIATCRPSESLSEIECEKILGYAIEGILNSNFKHNKFIDLDIETDNVIFRRISHKLKSAQGRLIVSYHNFETTPQPSELESIVKHLLSKGDIAKIATLANSTQDGVNVMNLYKKFVPTTLLAFCMGEPGKFTRRLSTDLGSPWTYTSLNNITSTAPGQFTFDELSELQANGNFPNIIELANIKPIVYAPASKSHLQRVIVASCLAEGVTTIDNFTLCNDSEAAIDLFRYLGVDFKFHDIDDNGNRTLVVSSSGIKGLRRFIDDYPEDIINLKTGESGLLTRLMIPVAAILLSGTGKKIVITGSGTILNREFAESREVLTQLGFDVKLNNNKLPIEISIATERNDNDTLKISGREGSQLISGLLMSLPLLEKDYTLSIATPSSTPYIDTTISTLKEFGIDIINNLYISYKTTGKSTYKTPSKIAIEGDWSSASALLVAGAIKCGTEVYNLKLNSGQADEKIFEVLLNCGADISFNHQKSSIIVKESIKKLNAFDFDATDSPDLFPSLTVLALNCKGVSNIKGVSRLFNKESNRAEALYSEFTKLGADIDNDGDIMKIKGGSLQGNYCFSYHDHRIAMALICLSLNIVDKVYIDDIDCIGKSFPGYINCFIKR